MNENSALKLPGAVPIADAAESLPPMTGVTIGSKNSVGELLRLAREKAGLSLGDVASRLRMGVKQVRALEQDDYAALPTGTFLRGFVRNFAKEVGVEPERALGLLAETHQAAASISASAVVMPSQQNINVAVRGGEFATPRARAFIAVAIMALLLTVGWWWWEYVRPHRGEMGLAKIVTVETVHVPNAASPTPLNAAPTAAPPSQESNLAWPVAPPLPDNSSGSTSLTATQAAPASGATLSAVATEIAPAASRAAPPAGSGQLGFTFSGISWVEVVDRNGKTVLDRKFKDGEVEEVVGRAPFSVVIGNAQVTRMAYNGKEIDLQPHTRASVARITVK